MLGPKDTSEIEAYYDRSKSCWRVDLAESFFDHNKEFAEQRAQQKLSLYWQAEKIVTENEQLQDEKKRLIKLCENCHIPKSIVEQALKGRRKHENN